MSKQGGRADSWGKQVARGRDTHPKPRCLCANPLPVSFCWRFASSCLGDLWFQGGSVLYCLKCIWSLSHFRGDAVLGKKSYCTSPACSRNICRLYWHTGWIPVPFDIWKSTCGWLQSEPSTTLGQRDSSECCGSSLSPLYCHFALFFALQISFLLVSQRKKKKSWDIYGNNLLMHFFFFLILKPPQTFKLFVVARNGCRDRYLQALHLQESCIDSAAPAGFSSPPLEGRLNFLP